jgi:hypothetical protein
MQPSTADYAQLLQVLKTAQSAVNDSIQKGNQVSSLPDLDAALTESIAQLEALSVLGSAIERMKQRP